VNSFLCCCFCIGCVCVFVCVSFVCSCCVLSHSSQIFEKKKGDVVRCFVIFVLLSSSHKSSSFIIYLSYLPTCLPFRMLHFYTYPLCVCVCE
jgi:hypothetical protein